MPGAQDLVNFSSVYSCLHIYTVLKAQETFKHYYQRQRKEQANWCCSLPPTCMKRNKNKVKEVKGLSK